MGCVFALGYMFPLVQHRMYVSVQQELQAEEEAKKRAAEAKAVAEAETKARLAKFREKNQADERVVDAHWDEIQVAVNASKRLVARGMSYEAVQKLKATRELKEMRAAKTQKRVR